MNASHAHETQGTSLVIRPNRSLPVTGMVALFVALGAWAIAIGIGFALAGAWLVLPFAGLQLLVVGLLCRWLYRHQDDCELVTTDADRVHVLKRHGAAVHRYEFARPWLRVRLDRRPPDGAPGTLSVGSHGKFIPLGEELNDNDRVLLARELRRLLNVRG